VRCASQSFGCKSNIRIVLLLFFLEELFRRLVGKVFLVSLGK